MVLCLGKSSSLRAPQMQRRVKECRIANRTIISMVQYTPVCPTSNRTEFRVAGPMLPLEPLAVHTVLRSAPEMLACMY